jgi:hypothetical protein
LRIIDSCFVKLQKVESEVGQCASPAIGRLLHQSERGYAVGADAAQLAVDLAKAAAVSGYFSVQSSPERVSS